jgi:hypothetical protein
MSQWTYELFVQCGSSSLYGYQFVNQEILYSLCLMYTFHYNQYVMWNVMDYIILVLSTFRTELLATNHLIIRERTKFDTEQKSEISAWNYDTSTFSTWFWYRIYSDGKVPYIYIMNNRGLRIGPWGTPCFIVPS